MIDTNALIATLAAGTGPTECMDLSDGAYIDWSSTDENGLVDFQLGEPVALGQAQVAARVALTREQLADLQRRLTLHLLTTE